MTLLFLCGIFQSTLTKVRSDMHRQGSSSSPPSSFAYIDELYEKYLDCLEDYCGNQVNRTASDRSSYFVESYLDEQEKYQLGATALDCSIMITFRRLAEWEEERYEPSLKDLNAVLGLGVQMDLQVDENLILWDLFHESQTCG